MPLSQRPNALWARWVSEAADSAAANGGREADSYKGAAAAIRGHPVALVHPSEALALKKVGPKTVAILTARLKTHCESEGLPFPATPPIPQGGRKKRVEIEGSPPRRRKKAKGAPRGRKRTPELTAEERALDDPTTSDEEHPIVARSASYAFNRPSNLPTLESASGAGPKDQEPARKPRGQKKEYVPGYRTGGWGIIIALYCAHDGAYDRANRTKDEIIERAQEFCDTSYVEPGARGGGAGNSGYYSAWSSMRKLKEEGITIDMPGRTWTLTQKGLAIARSLAKQESLPHLEIDEGRLPIGPIRHIPCPTPSQPAKTCRPSSKATPGLTRHIDSVSQAGVAGRSTSGKHSSTDSVGNWCDRQSPRTGTLQLQPDESDARFLFTYLDSNFRQVRSRCQADTKMEEVSWDLLYKVEFLEMQVSHQFKRNAIVDDEAILPARRPHSHPATRIGWIKKSKSVTICPGLGTNTTTGVPELQPSTSTGIISRPVDLEHNDASLPYLAMRLPCQPSFEHLSRSCSERSCNYSRETSTSSARDPMKISSTHVPDVSDASAIHGIEPEIWKAGTYNICLLLDHRELSSLDNRTAFFDLCKTEFLSLETRQQAELDVEQCALPLGDALWVAVHKFSGRRVVLDSIVERKRLDDLCSSILDDRFHEQKTRLKKSGLKDKIYLVEKYNLQANKAKFGQQIQTARAELMLVDNCHLEETNDWKTSVKYLVTRSRSLFEAHQNIDLRIIPDHQIERNTYLSTLSQLRGFDPTAYWVTSYASFLQLNDKSANLTIQQLWARMVNCVHGMSHEKAGSIVKRWNTPRAFWEAYKFHRTSDSSQPEKPWTWIQDADALEFRRIGPSLSKKVWDLFDRTEYDPDFSSC